MAGNGQWQLSAQAAELYERYVARYILGPWAPRLVDAAHVTMGERVVDVACGTGVVARVAAQRVGPTGRVVGADLNPAMIAVARSVAPVAGARIEWMERSALDLGLPDAALNVALCQQGLQFFPDKALAMREMRRVLAEGGRLALSVWSSIGLYNSAVAAALARYLGNDAANQFCVSRVCPDKNELRRLAEHAGFSAIEVRVSRMDVRLPRLDKFVLDHLSATPVAPLIVATPDLREQIGFSVMAELQHCAAGDGVSFPEETFVMTARA
jgi:ubiquinone/menaquinone biosynthesis C-methylase UbiE